MLLRSPSREQTKLELTESLLSAGVRVRVRALGVSMLPTIWPEDELAVERIDVRRIQPGDIAAFACDGRWFVHRVISVFQETVVTRGDSMIDEDRPVQFTQLLGRVVSVGRNGIDTAPSGRLSGSHRVLAWLFCRSNRIRNLALNFRRKESPPICPEGVCKFQPTTAR